MTNQSNLTVNGLSIAVQVDGLHHKLETLAENGRWTELSAAMKHRDELLSKVSNADRAIIFKDAVRANGRIMKLAQSGQRSVAHQLSLLRRSREASDQYKLHREKELPWIDRI